MSEPPSPDDLDSPTSAGAWDYLIGDYDNFSADRNLAGELERICPRSGDRLGRRR